VADQMRDLGPYRPVSRQPPAHRDLSIAVDGDATSEELGDRVREAMGDRVRDVEAIEILSETPEHALPEAARRRIGLTPGQKNVLLRVVLRSLDRSIGRDEANALRDRIYGVLHAGTAHQWARGGREPVRPRPRIS
jgi:phenylalanyl-tRNA synthetase alpha chain